MLNRIEVDAVITGVLEWLNEVAHEMREEDLMADEEITADTKPGVLIPSDTLVTKFSTLEERLNIEIPNSCYPFFDHKSHQQLSVQQAAEILMKKANHAK
jgi:hypothetical protein